MYPRYNFCSDTYGYFFEKYKNGHLSMKLQRVRQSFCLHVAQRRALLSQDLTVRSAKVNDIIDDGTKRL